MSKLQNNVKAFIHYKRMIVEKLFRQKNLRRIIDPNVKQQQLIHIKTIVL